MQVNASVKLTSYNASKCKYQLTSYNATKFKCQNNFLGPT